jgi:tetrahydromethanopterin S-methyltransferase subunit E
MATGWGNKTWGASDWGDLSNETVLVSSVALSTSIGSSTTQANADVVVSGINTSYTLQGAVAGASADVLVKLMYLHQFKVLLYLLL